MGIQITLKPKLNQLSQDIFIDMILEQFQLTDSHPTVLSIEPNTRLTKKDSVLDAEKHHFPQINYKIVYRCSNLYVTRSSVSHLQLPAISCRPFQFSPNR
jgi:hypothetical protein